MLNILYRFFLIADSHDNNLQLLVGKTEWSLTSVAFNESNNGTVNEFVLLEETSGRFVQLQYGTGAGFLCLCEVAVYAVDESRYWFQVIYMSMVALVHRHAIAN